MRSMFSRLSWMLGGVLALFVVATFADVIGAGPLDPPGPLGPTQHRLSDIPPAWHQTLPSNDGDGAGCNSTRFECVLSGLAVLDHETGIVWQRDVAAEATTYGAGLIACESLQLGGRYGWRIPSVHEMRTLMDTSADHLPDGHPFVGALTAGQDLFWTNSGNTSSNPAFYLVVDADAPETFLGRSEIEPARRWCVRGGTESDLRS